MCLTHREAEQTKTSGLGAEKNLLQGYARRQVAHALEKSLNSSNQNCKAFFKARLVRGCRVSDAESAQF